LLEYNYLLKLAKGASLKLSCTNSCNRIKISLPRASIVGGKPCMLSTWASQVLLCLLGRLSVWLSVRIQHSLSQWRLGRRNFSTWGLLTCSCTCTMVGTLSPSRRLGSRKTACRKPEMIREVGLASSLLETSCHQPMSRWRCFSKTLTGLALVSMSAT
jgi:hypothetical protein